MKKGTTEIYISKDNKIFEVFYHAGNATITKENGSKEMIKLEALPDRKARDGWKLIETK